MLNDWYKRCYRRVLVDMHIPDWREEFLSRLDPADYVDTLRSGKVASSMLYCVSHTGHSLYPTKIGVMHAGLKGRDFVGEATDLFHQHGLPVVSYVSVVFNNCMFQRHPEWRIKPLEGEAVYEHNRYGVCCPNSPYADHAVEQTEELFSSYQFDGVFFDMLFWPHICFCDHCRARFREEAGAELPEIVNWTDPTWMKFQRSREAWMSEFAGKLTAAVRRTSPSTTVTHQMSPVLAGWGLAMPYSLSEHCDYASGDFYGPAVQQSLVCKLFRAISNVKPYEFHTSRCVHLWDHVTMKTRTRLETQASLAPAHASAFMFIDAIDPGGTLNHGVYQRIGRIFESMTPYEPHLGGELQADVAIYMSSESRFDFRESGTPVNSRSRVPGNMAPGASMPHMNAVMGAARALQEAHVPFAVVTRANLDKLGDFRVLILPNVLLMSDDEIAATKQFVAGGGSIYASRYTSLHDMDGRRREDFGMAAVLGVSYRGLGVEGLSFLTPAEDVLASVIAPQDHMIHQGGQFEIGVTDPEAEVLATVTLPWYPEGEGTVLKPSFSSIHSNPPGPAGTAPAVVWRSEGKGRVCYAASAIEAEDRPINREVIAMIVRHLLGGPARVECEAPKHIEITAFDRADAKAMNVSLVSLSDADEALPCNAKVTVRLGDGRKPLGVRLLPDMIDVEWTEAEDGAVEFAATGVEILAMYELRYE